MITPINNQLLVEYQLEEREINRLYPINPDGISNMSNTDLERYPQYNPRWTFEQAIAQPQFPLILFERLGYVRHLDTCKVIEVSKKLSNEYSHLLGQEVVLSNVDAISSLSGLKYEMDYKAGKILALITPQQIMAHKAKNNTLKPIHNFVELEFDFPQELRETVVDDKLVLPGLKTSDGQSLESSTLTQDEAMKEIKNYIGGATISQTVPTVSAVYSKNAQVKVGDKVLIINDYGFELNRICRIDIKRKKLYFIKPETIILGIENV
jgi:hypothetical protein